MKKEQRKSYKLIAFILIILGIIAEIFFRNTDLWRVANISGNNLLYWTLQTLDIFSMFVIAFGITLLTKLKWWARILVAIGLVILFFIVMMLLWGVLVSFWGHA